MKKLLKHYWPEIWKYKHLVIVMVLSLCITVAIEMSFPFLFRSIVDNMQASFLDTPENYAGLRTTLLYLAFAYGGMWLGWRINELCIVFFETRSMRDMEVRAFRAIESQSVKFFKETFTGSLVKKIARFTNAFENLADIFYFNFLREFIKIIGILTIFYFEKPVFTLLFLLWSTIFVGGSYLYATLTLRYGIEAAKYDSKVSAAIADSLSNVMAIKTFAKEIAELERFRDISWQRYRKRLYAWLSHNALNILQATLMLGAEFGLIWFSIEQWKEGTFTAGDFMFLQTAIFMLFHSLWDFGRKIQNAFEARADAEEMIEIFENSIDVLDKKDAKAFEFKEGKIEMKDMSFTFQSDNKVLFEDFNLTIQPGERVALVGPSGGGKSTLTSLLFRFYDVTNGSIKIDGQNIADVTQRSLRKHISLVPQTPELFHRSIAENIAFGRPDASLDEIKKAAKMAHADVFIEQLEKGYNTLVGERGVKLSGGERQRIAIARAFVENAPILILDEATSALDSIAEKHIQNAIFALMENRTSIVIAHRLSTILSMDRIVVIKDGRIVEQGKHQELLDKNGLYSTLWKHQGGLIGDI